MRLASLGFLFLTLFATGCASSTYQASSGIHFDIDGAGREIDDTDVLKAFEARPQLPGQAKVAYYTFDDERAPDVEKMLVTVPGVASTYRIPKLMVTGQRKFQETTYGQTVPELSVKKLRLLAARAHADVLVVFDHGFRGGGVNAWAALNILIVPMLVTPWLSNETESYAQAYVVDVRNGFLYGEATADAKGGKSAVTIYGDKVSDVAEQQWLPLLDNVKGQLGKKLAEGAAPAPVVPGSPAPASMPAAAGMAP